MNPRGNTRTRDSLETVFASIILLAILSSSASAYGINMYQGSCDAVYATEQTYEPTLAREYYSTSVTGSWDYILDNEDGWHGNGSWTQTQITEVTLTTVPIETQEYTIDTTITITCTGGYCERCRTIEETTNCNNYYVSSGLMPENIPCLRPESTGECVTEDTTLSCEDAVSSYTQSWNCLETIDSYSKTESGNFFLETGVCIECFSDPDCEDPEGTPNCEACNTDTRECTSTLFCTDGKPIAFNNPDRDPEDHQICWPNLGCANKYTTKIMLEDETWFGCCPEGPAAPPNGTEVEGASVMDLCFDYCEKETNWTGKRSETCKWQGVSNPRGNNLAHNFCDATIEFGAGYTATITCTGTCSDGLPPLCSWDGCSCACPPPEDVEGDLDVDGTPDVGDVDGTPDVEGDVDLDGEVTPDVDGDGDLDGEVTPDVEGDVDVDGTPDVEGDLDGDGTPDVEGDVDGDGTPDVEGDVDGDGDLDVEVTPDVDGDLDVDGTPDVEGDVDGTLDVGDGDVDLELTPDADAPDGDDADLPDDIELETTPDADIDLDNPDDIELEIELELTPIDSEEDVDVAEGGDGDVDLPVTPDLDVGDGDLELDFEVDDGECPVSMCWLECVDDLNTDGNCFRRTVLPFWCSSGVCCLSNMIPCEDAESDGDADSDIEGEGIDFDGDFDTEAEGTPDLDADGLPDIDSDIDFSMSCNVNLSLDVANDSHTPWEWQNTGYETSERLWSGAELNPVVNKINSVLRHGCEQKDCVGCFSEGDICFIPFVYRSGGSESEGPYGGGSCPGCLTVEDIKFSYWITETIFAVPYGRRLRFSCGGLWEIRFNLSRGIVEAETFAVPPDADCPDLWTDTFYTNNTPPSGLDAFDAIDDAMYRLLDEKLDVNPKDGVVEQLDIDHDGLPETHFNTNKMWFDTQDQLGIQTMWGPELFKLIAWIE